MLGKHNEHYMNVALSMLAVIKAVHLEPILMNEIVSKSYVLDTSVDGDVTAPDHRDINVNMIKNNVQIIYSHGNWNVLLYKETIRIKELKPLLNISLKRYLF